MQFFVGRFMLESGDVRKKWAVHFVELLNV